MHISSAVTKQSENRTMHLSSAVTKQSENRTMHLSSVTKQVIPEFCCLIILLPTSMFFTVLN